jgi:hypothetical protein
MAETEMSRLETAEHGPMTTTESASTISPTKTGAARPGFLQRGQFLLSISTPLLTSDAWQIGFRKRLTRALPVR